MLPAGLNLTKETNLLQDGKFKFEFLLEDVPHLMPDSALIIFSRRYL